jgi:uncharacterized BrkB/YihY/UPF0761 family membrane protein
VAQVCAWRSTCDGAALAFYTFLSLAPLVVLAIAISALVFGHSAAKNNFVAEVQNMIGQQGAGAVKTMIEHAQKPASGTVASIVGVITLLFDAYGAAGSIIVIIVWVYYSAMIFLFGAELTHVLDSGTDLPPNKAKPA